ncbi:MAG: VWA domain-containing protein [Ardenticatenales bacterium]|jgi:Mg-chelatase subunit ChlD|nr:VWA domain-containing protein [Ardenticatenales bacterium]
MTRARWWGVECIAASLVTVALLAAAVTVSSVAAETAPPIDSTDLVFVTEDIAVDQPGCDAISVLNVVDGSTVHRGDTLVSPGRLAVHSDLTTSLATLANSWGTPIRDSGIANCAPALVALDLSSPQRADPRSRRLTGEINYATHGGIAFLSDGTFVVAEADYLAMDCRNAFLVPQAPHFITRGRLVDNDPAHPSGVALLDRTPLDALAIEFFHSSATDRLVAALANGTVVTLDPATTRQVDAPIAGASTALQDFSATQARRLSGALHATMDPDGSRVVMNGMRDRSVLLFDLERRTSKRLPIGDGVPFVGGVAWNAGWVNRDLLAVHFIHSIGIYRIDDDGTLTELSRAAIPPPYESEARRTELLGGGETSPMFAVAWSASGQYVIAASNSVAAEFVVIEVSDDGRSQAIRRFLTACPDLGNFPNDIWTANGLVTPSPTPTVTSTSTVTAPPSDTPVPTLERTATPSATPTAQRRRLFLPLAHRERCLPDEQRLDVALVLDASTSMLERTVAGRTKLDAATEAARMLLDLLRLDKGDQAALIAFNADVLTLQTLTSVRSDLDGVLTRIALAQQTRIDLGILAAANELGSVRHRPTHTPVMVVLTDGRANPVPVDVAVANAAAAKAAGITIYTVGVGADLDVDALRAMASSPEHVHLAPDAEQLADVYRTIAVALPCAGRYWPAVGS